MSDLVIVGAGLSRTGTMSIKTALEEMGFGPCDHGVEMGNWMTQDLWLKYFNGDKQGLIDFKKDRKYRSSLDMPCNAFFDEFYEREKNAKVLLTVRDSPAAWVKSYRLTIDLWFHQPWYGAVLLLCYGPFSSNSKRSHVLVFAKSFELMIKKGNSKAPIAKLPIKPWIEYNDKELELFYENWVNYVIQTVPKEKLLIFNVKEGIEPLATFCEVDLPNWKMPFINDANEIRKHYHLGMLLAKLMTTSLFVLTINLINNFLNIFTQEYEFISSVIALFMLLIPIIFSTICQIRINQHRNEPYGFHPLEGSFANKIKHNKKD